MHFLVTRNPYPFHDEPDQWVLTVNRGAPGAWDQSVFVESKRFWVREAMNLALEHSLKVPLTINAASMADLKANPDYVPEDCVVQLLCPESPKRPDRWALVLLDGKGECFLQRRANDIHAAEYVALALAEEMSPCTYDNTVIHIRPNRFAVDLFFADRAFLNGGGD